MSVTREKILREAFNLFLQSTYSEVSLNDIVKKVGLTKGAFYHHFKSKEELFTELIEKFIIAGQDNVYDGIPRDNLKGFMLSYIDRIAQYIDKIKTEIDDINAKRGIYFFSILFDALRQIDTFGGRVMEMHASEKSIWTEVISNAKKSGEVTSNISDSHLARLFINVNDGVGMHLMLEGRYDDIPGEIYTAWNGLYNMIKTR